MSADRGGFRFALDADSSDGSTSTVDDGRSGGGSGASDAVATEGAAGAGGDDRSDRSRAALLGELDLLADENRRLRAAADERRRRAGRRTALGAAMLGVVAAVGGLLVPSSATVLFALAGVGLFTGLLTYYLTPERTLAAPVGERVYAAYAATGDELVADLGLADVAVYLPVGARARAGSERDDVAPVRLFVPRDAAYEVPTADEATTTFVVADDDRRRGVSVVPTGAALLAAFERGDADDLVRLPLGEYASRVVDALVDGFELVDSAAAEVDVDAERVTVRVRDSALGPLDRFDHPVGSFVGAALARRLDAPVRLETRAVADGRADYLLVYRWGAGRDDADDADPGVDGDDE